jgi:predicted XRE-type DNA-binding protein
VKKKTDKNFAKNGTTDVWAFLGFSEDEAAKNQLKVMLYEEILGLVRTKQLSQAELVEILGEPQPRISDLVRGRFAKFSSDKLFSYLTKLEPDQQFVLQRARRTGKGPRAS